MNRTLLLRLDGPLQSWNSSLALEESAIRFPTAVDLVSMIITALETGPGKADADLRFLETAVRADEPGHLVTDFQTPKHSRRYPATPAEDARIKVLRRGFTADAVFTAAVSGTVETVESAASALRRPSRQLFLGRRCCPPAAPILLGLSDRPALEALGAVPYQGHRDQPPKSFEVAIYSPALKMPGDNARTGREVAPSKRIWTRTDLTVPA